LYAFQSLFFFFEVYYSPFSGCSVLSILSACIHLYSMYFSIPYAALVTANSASIVLLCIQTVCISCQWTDDSDHWVHSLFILLMVYLAVQSVSRLCSVNGKRMNVSMEHWWSDTDGKIEVLKEKPVPVPLRPPQFPYWLAWIQTSTFVVGNWWLTPWTINDSLHFVVMNFVLVIEMGMYPLAMCQYFTISQNVNISLKFQLCSLCPSYRIQPFKPFCYESGIWQLAAFISNSPTHQHLLSAVHRHVILFTFRTQFVSKTWISCICSFAVQFFLNIKFLTLAYILRMLSILKSKRISVQQRYVRPIILLIVRVYLLCIYTSRSFIHAVYGILSDI
jgi:hypothetical protein